MRILSALALAIARAAITQAQASSNPALISLPPSAPTELSATAPTDAELARITAAWLSGFADNCCGF